MKIFFFKIHVPVGVNCNASCKHIFHEAFMKFSGVKHRSSDPLVFYSSTANEASFENGTNLLRYKYVLCGV